MNTSHSWSYKLRRNKLLF